MTGTQHVSPDRILDIIECRDEATAAIREHLRGCAECGVRARDFERLLALLEIARIPEPGEALIRSTWERIQTRETPAAERRPARAGLRERLREIWATLAADSMIPSPAVRGSQTASPRLLVYETPFYAISLSISRDERRRRTDVHGRLIPRSEESLPPGGTARLSAAGSAREESLGRFGSFLFQEIPPGPIRIEIEIGNELLRVPPIEEASEGERE